MNDRNPSKKSPSRRSSQTWHLVTNHQNMLYMLAAGLVMGPTGFSGKHYADPLAVFPGCIPLFRDINNGKGYIPADAIEQAASERKHLRPCIASFDLSSVTGPASRLKRDGGFRGVDSISTRKHPNDIAQMLPAPLPINLLQSITFRSDEDLQMFKTAARDVGNVELPDSLITVDESLFNTDAKIDWPLLPQQEELMGRCNDCSPQSGQAIGGMLAMLYYAANRSDLGLAAFHMAMSNADGDVHESLQKDPVLREFSGWLEKGDIDDKADERAKIYWGAIKTLIETRYQGSSGMLIDALLGYLEDSHKGMQEPKFKGALELLIADIRGCQGLGGGTITELFERHRGPLSRSLLLFSLRSKSKDLIEFSHPMLGDSDYILACILFGVRDGWLQLPRELRDPSLSAYVAYRMAAHEHQSQKSQLSFRSAPPPPVPLRAYFSATIGDWSRRKEELALDLSKNCDWNDCIQTYITPIGENALEFDKQDNGIIVRGSVSVSSKVNSAAFLRRLGQWPLVPFDLQARLRNDLEQEKNEEVQKSQGDLS